MFFAFSFNLYIPKDIFTKFVKSAGYEVSEKKSKRWKPEMWEQYWYVDCCNDVKYSHFDGSEAEYYHYTNNYFKTREEAEAQQKKNAAIMRVKKYIIDNDYEIEDVNWGDSEEEKWQIYYDKFNNKLGLAYWNVSNSKPLFGNIISKEACEDIIKNCREDLIVALS